MTPIVIPENLKSSFGFDQPTTVCDEQGNVLGYYTPAREATDADYNWALNNVTEAELDFSKNSGPGRPLADILADLHRKYGP